MNLRLDVEILGWLLVGIGALQLPPLAVAVALGESPLPFAQSAVTAFVLGLSVALSSRSADRRMRTRDGFLVVSGAWILACLFGTLPYLLTGSLGFVDAVFESASGFTTTGATVMAPIEGNSKALLLWRAITQWLGGMGIIVFAIAVLPLLGVGGMNLFQAEVPGPIADKLTPRIADTARRLWLIYAGLTALAGIVYWALGMSPFEAVCHALTSVATGGFSTRDASIAAFASPPIEWSAVLFMGLGGINFVLLWQILRGDVRRVARDAELRLYLGALVVGIAIVALAIWRAGAGSPLQDTLRSASFQVVSIATTTGYATSDWELWPALAQFVVLVFMVVGAMAGSTGGGIKSLHLLLAWRKLRAVLALSTHRHAVVSIDYRGRPVSEGVVIGVFAFFLAYIGLVGLGACALAVSGADLLTAITAALSAVGNVGPAFGSVGPAEHYGHLSSSAKAALSFCMVAGRLEIFTFLVVFAPSFWRR